jgi:hypothetical protein
MLNDIWYLTTAALQLIMLLPPRVNSDWGELVPPYAPLPPPHTWGGGGGDADARGMGATCSPKKPKNIEA